MNHTQTTRPLKLTKRQKQLMSMLEQGLSNPEIAAQLALSEHTIKVHFGRLFKRINVKSRGQALRWYHDHLPSGIPHALRAAFDAACRLHDQLKVDGGEVDIEEFEYHRAQVAKLQGGAA